MKKSFHPCIDQVTTCKQLNGVNMLKHYNK